MEGILVEQVFLEWAEPKFHVIQLGVMSGSGSNASDKICVVCRAGGSNKFGSLGFLYSIPYPCACQGLTAVHEECMQSFSKTRPCTTCRREICQVFRDGLTIIKTGPTADVAVVAPAALPGAELYGHYRSYYPNGTVKKECVYRAGSLEGPFATFYENGGAHESAVYLRGMRNGEYRRWFDNSQIEVECTYESGREQGLYKAWHRNGRVHVITQYRFGMMHGLYREYYESGLPARECSYYAGQLVGTYIEWGIDGEKTQEFTLPGGGWLGEHLGPAVGEAVGNALERVYSWLGY